MHILHGGPAGSTYALYGAREPLLLPPLQFADEAAIHAFLEPYWQTAAGPEAFRHALIAQGIFPLTDHAGLRGQTTHALKAGVLRPAPVAVSGLQPVKTEPARATLSGKPYVPPRRENPRPESAPPEPRYKVALEIAGQSAAGVAGALAISPVDTPSALRMLPSHSQGTDPHRLECALNGLPNTPFSLWYPINMQGGSPMRLRLIKSLQPVDQDAQQARWPTVLVPVLPLRHLTPHLDRAQAMGVSSGWVYVYLNGHLWRELQVINAHGTLRDVDLGANDGVGDKRVARGQYTSQIVVPHLLAGAEQKVEMLYSRRQFTWAALMKLGGLAPDDPRFTQTTQQDNANTAVDEDLRKQLLQPVDLSSYGSGFNAGEGVVGPVATALRNDNPDARNPLSHWREEHVPVVYLADRPVKKSVISVVAGMGIFSARLEREHKDPKKKYVWDPDNEPGIVGQYAKSKLSAFIARDWSDKDILAKTDRLHAAAQVMNDYAPELKPGILKSIKKSEHFQRRLRDAGPNPDADADAEKEYQRRKERGWFGVLAEYAALFEAIEAVEDEHFVYRVWAVGMDWRGDLAKAAEHLKAEIERIKNITDYPELGTKGVHYEAGTHKVLAVTHSQGSLITRYASEVLGANANIQGIVHLNQPTTGAPALYRRFVSGASPERESLFFNLGGLKSTAFNNVFSEVLGTTSYHFTRMAGPMIGALCLLPTNDYVHRPRAKTGEWLHCPARGLKPEVINDVYTENLYLNDSVGLISHKRYDTEGKPKPYTAQEFEKVWYHDVRGYFYDVLRSRVDRARVPENAHAYLPEETPWHRDNMRLRPHEGMPDEEWKVAKVWFDDFKKYLSMAQAFHSALREEDGSLKQHPNTYVIRSNGLNTVTQVRLLLNADKNGDSVLESPYERTKDGDGTVPLTSQEALLTTLKSTAKPQGPKAKETIIVDGNVVHAKICEHTEAIGQTQDAIAELVKELRPKDQARLYVSSPPHVRPTRGKS